MLTMTITDALKNSVLEGFSTSISTADILLGLAMSLVAGLFILLVYRHSMRRIAFNRSFCITLLLVCSISAMVVLTITSNLALSLGMVGALSIVRFRTAIKDASDTAFMFWAVAAGITAGAGFYMLTIIGCLVVGLICIISVILLAKVEKPFLLVVKAAQAEAADQVELTLKQSGIRYQLSSMITGELGLEMIYELGLSNKNKSLVLRLGEIPGVSGVSLVDCHKSV